VDDLDLLQTVLRIDTTNPPGNEAPAAEALEAAMKGGGLEVEMVAPASGRPTVIGRVPGPRNRPALVLLSHTDVVGVEEDRWTHDPFGGEVADGYIWGRGALDMKSIAVMHVAAATALARGDVSPAREVIVVAVPDEETGGADGAAWIVEHHADKVGFGAGRPLPEVMGEGAYGITGILDVPVLPVALGEKNVLWIEARAVGEPGHGSMPPPRRALEEMATFVSRVGGYGKPRVHPIIREQLRILSDRAIGRNARIFRALASRAGDQVARILARRLRASGVAGTLLSDTATPTQMRAGYKHNVVPGEAIATFDCRLLPDTDPDGYLGEVQRIAERHGITVEAVARHTGPVSDAGPLFEHLRTAAPRVASDAVVVPTISPPMTDVRYFRSRGATGYGWIPLVLTPELLGTIHGHDERIPVDGFAAAVRAMTDAVQAASS
jgi:acetylornithine deacetylase/succinyl-diaminopimelate desuccinylase-like protein